jgi:sugar phosphate isomerase/epimerase
MIRLACNAMMRDAADSDRWLPVETLIEQVHELGFDAIDFQLDRGPQSHEPAYLESIRKKCENYELPIGFFGIGGGFVDRADDAEGHPVGIPLRPEERARRIAEAKSAIDASAMVGAPLIRMFGGGIPERSGHRDTLWQAQVDAVRELCDYGATKGVKVGLHNHPPAVPPTGDDILKWISDVDHDYLTYILDTGQWHGSPGTNREGNTIPGIDFYGFMQQTVSHATYVRTKIYKIDSGTEEWLDYPRIAKIILDAGYDGVISIVFEDRNNNCGYLDCWRLGAAHLRACFGLTS